MVGLMLYKNNLKVLRSGKNLTQTQVAELLSIGQAEYSRIEAGKRRIYPHKEKLAEILKIRLDNIVEVDQEGAALNKAPLPPQLPVYGFPLASGQGFDFTQQMMSKVDRPDELLDVDDAYACFCFGDRLKPVIKNGDLAFVNPNIEPRDGGLVVVRLDSNGKERGLLAQLVTTYKVGATVQFLEPFEEMALGAEVKSVEPVVMVKYAI
jgi:transcriptional regulator with XRE-family HTH domain